MLQIINLDFANENLPYKCAIDVRELVSLEVLQFVVVICVIVYLESHGGIWVRAKWRAYILHGISSRELWVVRGPHIAIGIPLPNIWLPRPGRTCVFLINVLIYFVDWTVYSPSMRTSTNFEASSWKQKYRYFSVSWLPLMQRAFGWLLLLQVP